MLMGMRWINWLLAAGFVAILPVHGQQVGGPIGVPYNAHPVLRLRGEGLQIYHCQGLSDWAGRHYHAPKTYRWFPAGPDAKLLDADGKVIGTLTVNPSWKSDGWIWKLDDASTVEGEEVAAEASPEAGSMMWSLLRVKADSASGRFANVAYVRETDTHGGAPDKHACRDDGDGGKTVRLPYTATYTFYSAPFHRRF